ncbi:hypothetical protein N431DRAFT_456000 [Stipitochalara longipes BDJ]|nr:hypothetical protein N431DRAFT_456000 [Stipitochalara longipes BDJ]
MDRGGNCAAWSARADGRVSLKNRDWWCFPVERIRPWRLRGAKKPREKSLLDKMKERPVIRSKPDPSASRTKRQNLDVEGLHAGRCDISSLSFQCDGQYVYGFLTFHGSLVQDPLASYNDIDALPPLELPGSGSPGFATVGFDEGSKFRDCGESTAAFQNSVENSILENNDLVEAPRTPERQNGNLGPILGAIKHANLELNFNFSSHLEKIPFQTTAEQHCENYQTFQRPFSVNFDQANPDDVFCVNDNGRKADCADGFEANTDYPVLRQDTAFSLDTLDILHGAENNLNASSALPEMSLSSNEFTFPNSAPSSYQESSISSASSSSSSKFNFSDNGPIFSQESSVSSAASTSSSEFGVSESTPKSGQATSFSSISPFSSSNTAVSKPRDNPPKRQSCLLCRSTFKRVGDLKRHQGVHLPRNFHCKQSGCGRKGKNGFYRKDKLRAHERQVHGMDL